MNLEVGRLSVEAGGEYIRIGRFWVPDGLHVWWGARGFHLWVLRSPRFVRDW